MKYLETFTPMVFVWVTCHFTYIFNSSIKCWDFFYIMTLVLRQLPVRRQFFHTIC